MSKKPIYLDELINKASTAAGNDSKLAKRLHQSRSVVSDWRSGRQTCPPADQALMADLAGLDADAWAARAVIAQHEGTEKGELLKQALKKAFVATGAAVATFSAQASSVIDWIAREKLSAIGTIAMRLYTMYMMYSFFQS